MTSSEERHEVAERLRTTKAECDERGYPWMVEELLQALGFERYEDGEDGIFDRLADLIDPTCNFEESADNEDFSIRVVFGYICHDCGHETIVESTAGGWAEPPHYCTNCGARLVSDDDQ